jgi:Na+/H+ antiporter NhaC
MSDKFRYNFFLVLPIAVIVCVIYLLMGSGAGEVEAGRVMGWKIIPYAAVLISAACGMNVMLVLLMGNVLTGIVGIADGSYSLLMWCQSMTSGIMGMSELILISMMAGGIFALINRYGLMEKLIRQISKKVRTQRGAELSICLLTAIANTLTANNTVAILSVGQMAKTISKRFNIDARRSASLLDTTSCTVQGLLPYGAQLLMASSIAGISALQIMPYLYYPMLMGMMVVLTIVLSPKKRKHITE